MAKLKTLKFIFLGKNTPNIQMLIKSNEQNMSYTWPIISWEGKLLDYPETEREID